MPDGVERSGELEDAYVQEYKSITLAWRGMVKFEECVYRTRAFLATNDTEGLCIAYFVIISRIREYSSEGDLRPRDEAGSSERGLLPVNVAEGPQNKHQLESGTAGKNEPQWSSRRYQRTVWGPGLSLASKARVRRQRNMLYMKFFECIEESKRWKWDTLPGAIICSDFCNHVQMCNMGDRGQGLSSKAISLQRRQVGECRQFDVANLEARSGKSSFYYWKAFSLVKYGEYKVDLREYQTHCPGSGVA